jgi:hypothetical protein
MGAKERSGITEREMRVLRFPVFVGNGVPESSICNPQSTGRAAADLMRYNALALQIPQRKQQPPGKSLKTG